MIFDMWPTDAVGIVQEAVREFVGDGEGRDEQVLAEYNRIIRGEN